MYHLQKNWSTLLKCPEVRDLAWVIFSPSLLDENAAVKCMKGTFLGLDNPSFDPLISHLQKLNQNPEPLLKIIRESNIRRLGDYFELLTGYFLAHMPCCHKLEHNTLLKNGQKTVGEFDFLFYSDVLQQMIHWEVAVKFYLLDPTGQFRGINPEDTLSHKIITLSRQVGLSQKGIAKKFLTAHNLLPIESGCLVRGTLFYPLDDAGNYHPIATHGVNEEHLFGWWDSIDSPTWKERTAKYKLLHLPRLNWLAPRVYGEAPPPFEPQPGLVACLIEQEGEWIEAERGMLVPGTWPGAQA